MTDLRRRAATATAIRLVFTSLLFLISGYAGAQKASSLPRSTPEAQGISSEGILAFLDAADKSKHEFHSVMILRHGKVVAEGWWNQAV